MFVKYFSAVSDLHGHKPILPGGDILIIGGDCTTNDGFKSWEDFFEWLKDQEYTHKIFIGGNHDNMAQKHFLKHSKQAKMDELLQAVGEKVCKDFIYLQDEEIEVEGLHIYGSPWTLNFTGQNPDCQAFGVDREIELAEKFASIPENLDILITHSPPFGILDRLDWGKCVGSPSLLEKVKQVRPRYHAFGHIHDPGQSWIEKEGTTFINAAGCDEFYNQRPVLTNFELTTPYG